METPFFIHASLPGAPPQTFKVDQPKDDGFLIGRARSADLRIANPTISGSHARLLRDDKGVWTLSDLDSRNGITVAGAPATSVQVTESLTVEMGQATLRFSTSESAPSPAPQHQPANTLNAEEVAISRLGERDATATTRARIAEIAAAGHSLWTIDDDDTRRQALCDLLISPTMDAWSAIVLKLDTTTHKATTLARAQKPNAPPLVGEYVSKRMIAAIADDPAPALGRTHALANDEIHLSIDAGASSLAAVVCRLSESDTHLEVLFLTLPPYHGTQSRLLELAMIAEQFRGAAAAAALRIQRADAARRDSEFERARGIQENLLPNAAATRARGALIHAEPCYEVGGDYADVIPIDDDRTILILADVAGKGLHAALVAAQIHSLCNFSVSNTNSLEDLAARLNALMARHMDLAVFATAVIALIDRPNKKLFLVNAGHPTPFIAAADASVTPLLTDTAPPLGAIDETPPVTAHDIKPGDTILLYSDGLSELPDPNGLLGVEGVQTLFQDACNAANSLDDRLIALQRQLTDINTRYPIKSDDQTFLIADLLPR